MCSYGLYRRKEDLREEVKEEIIALFEEVANEEMQHFIDELVPN